MIGPCTGDHGIGTAHILHIFAGSGFRGQVVEIGRVAIVPAHVALIDGAAVVLEGAVVPAPCPEGFKFGGQAQHLRDLGPGVARVHQPNRLVVHILVEVALPLEIVAGAGIAPARPVMALEHDLRLVAIEVDRLVNIVGPDLGVPDKGAPQGEDIVHGGRGVLGHPQGPVRGEPGVHFGRRLGAGGQLEQHAHAVDHHLFAGFGDFAGGREQAYAAGRGAHAQPCRDCTPGARRDEGAEHVDGTPAHRVAGDNILRDGVLEEALRCQDLHLAGLHILFRDDPPHAAVVIDMAVAVDDRHNRAPTLVFRNQLIGGPRRLCGHKRVEHDPAGLAADEGDVGEIVSSNLVDAVRHLEQAGEHVEAGVAPEAGVHTVRRRGVRRDEGPVLLKGPGWPLSIVARDGEGHRAVDQAAAGILEILPVSERECLQNRGVGRASGFCRGTGGWLGVDDAAGGQGQCGNQAACNGEMHESIPGLFESCRLHLA